MKKTFSINQIGEVAKEFVGELKNTNPKDRATIVALSGDLGAGKTTLTQAIARELGIKEKVISPTFVIMKNYVLDFGKYKQLIHIDAYRLNSHLELLKLGFKEIISDSNNLILIEWPEKVAEIIPKDSHKIFLSHKSEEEREIDILLTFS